MAVGAASEHAGARARRSALFSIWRLAWIAHALPYDPMHVFDANIFYPHARTLAFSDAMLFEGILAAPFLWAGVNQVLVYNLMFLAGILSSGAGMFVLVRYLTGNIGAALVSAAIFTLAPYRIEHVIHLELQWTVWIPLALWQRRQQVHSHKLSLVIIRCVGPMGRLRRYSTAGGLYG